MGRVIRTPRNVYILDELQGEKCCIGQIDEGCLWHKRLCHLSFCILVKSNRTQVERYAQNFKTNKHYLRILPIWETNKLQVKIILNIKTTRAFSCVSMYTNNNTNPTRWKVFYFLYWWLYRMIWVSFLREKLKALETFTSFKALVENETILRIKCLRLDRGGEFT